MTHRKSYTGFRLALNSVTLNANIGGFMDFSALSGCDKSISFTRRRHGTGVGGVA